MDFEDTLEEAEFRSGARVFSNLHKTLRVRRLGKLPFACNHVRISYATHRIRAIGLRFATSGCGSRANYGREVHNTIANLILLQTAVTELERGRAASGFGTVGAGAIHSNGLLSYLLDDRRLVHLFLQLDLQMKPRRDAKTTDPLQ